MASFYANLAATATRLLTSKGQAVSFSRDNVSSFDPVTGVETTGAPTTYSGVGAVFDYNRQEVDGAAVLSTDKRLILNSVSTAPEVGDVATVASIAYRVQGVNDVSPGGENVYYELQLRR